MVLAQRIQIVNELLKQRRYNFKRRKTIVLHFYDLAQADLADMSNYSKNNSGYRFIAVLINCYNNKIFTRAIKSKTASDVIPAYREMFEEAGARFENLVCDRGGEYTSAKFKTFAQDELNTKLSYVYSPKKAAIVERYVKEIKFTLIRDLVYRNSKKWFHRLKEATDFINNRKHSRWGYAPNEINEQNQQIIKHFHEINFEKAKPKFKIGDYVRIAFPKGLFEKSYFFKFTNQIFKIAHVSAKKPERYRVLDSVTKQLLPRQMYEQELVKVADKNYWLVEVIKRDRKNKKIYVSYTGIDGAREWIDEEDYISNDENEK